MRPVWIFQQLEHLLVIIPTENRDNAPGHNDAIEAADGAPALNEQG